ncbi:hypothetical protein QJS04_geneDACA004481 [Acorus gramineus]|uniref:Uncharacterized protein n=1 Tax=Acorus gramineus TaxID=55184 RepID=A0AAV9B6N0_ACOGR|nr:hypothetical protein QJS04_geneDACA004481 [Acorus gramineus]
MAASIVKIFFCFLSSISNFASFAIFKGSAVLLVLAIQTLRVPGLALNVVLKNLQVLIKTGLESSWNLLTDVIVSLVCGGFDLLKEGISSLLDASNESEGLRDSIKSALVRLIPEFFEELLGLIKNVVSDLWNNYKDALAYVFEKAPSKS